MGAWRALPSGLLTITSPVTHTRTSNMHTFLLFSLWCVYLHAVASQRAFNDFSLFIYFFFKCRHWRCQWNRPGETRWWWLCGNQRAVRVVGCMTHLFDLFFKKKKKKHLLRLHTLHSEQKWTSASLLQDVPGQTGIPEATAAAAARR